MQSVPLSITAVWNFGQVSYMYNLHDFVTLHSMLDNFLRVKGYGCRLGVTLCYNISLFKNDAMRDVHIENNIL